MNYFENSVRVPLLVSHPRQFQPRRVKENVSTIDILPTMCDLVGTKPVAGLPMDGLSLLPHLQGKGGHDKVYGEYTGEGTISPLMMIKEGPWKYVYCPSDGTQLFNLAKDPLELVNLAKEKMDLDEETRSKLHAFENERKQLWDFDQITKDVIHSQRKRRFVWSALRKGRFTSWDFDPVDDGTTKYVIAIPECLGARVQDPGLTHSRYIRSHVPLDELERRARFPAVDAYGRETTTVLVDQAGSHGE
jgi:hypothetical protein